MALALVLRNVSKAQVGALLQQNLLKGTTVAINRDFTQICNQNRVKSVMPMLKMMPHTRAMSADHGSLWALEKALSVGLIFIVPATIAAPNFLFDNLFAVASVVHFHWGLEAVVVDYARPIVIGTVLSKAALGLLYIISATTLGGLIYYNVNDIGIGKTIRQFWAIGKKAE